MLGQEDTNRFMWSALRDARVGLGCRNKACVYMGMQGECAPWVFKGILVLIYASYEDNQLKFRKAMPTSATGDWTRHFSSTSFEHSIAWSLMGLRDVYNFNQMYCLISYFHQNFRKISFVLFKMLRL